MSDDNDFHQARRDYDEALAEVETLTGMVTSLRAALAEANATIARVRAVCDEYAVMNTRNDEVSFGRDRTVAAVRRALDGGGG